MLHLFAVLVAASTFALIFAGGLVTSTGSGLAVPDWPNSYGWFMFTFPAENWVGGIFYEHVHRLVASAVGFLILVLAFWLWRVEPRRWVRRLGFIALAAVITQGVLGGITVLWYLPDPISIAHASLAQLVLCMTVTIALVTSPGWKRGYAAAEGPARHTPPGFVALPVLIYLQIVVGATMRHIDAGLAIQDFPLAFGRVIPPYWDTGIAVHFAHRVGALLVSIAIMATAAHVFFRHRRRELVRPVLLLLALLPVQITLGAVTVLGNKPYIINSLHVVTGAVILATALVLALRTQRARFAQWEHPERFERLDRSERMERSAPAERPAVGRA
jgi:heme a synthase